MLLQTGIDAEVVESIEQFTSMWRVFLEERGDSDTTDWPDTSIRWADCAFPFWNMLFLTEKVIDSRVLAIRLRYAAAYMRSKREAGFVAVCEEYLTRSALASLHDVASQAGLEHASTAHGMAGDFLPIPSPAHPSLRFARVRTEKALRAYADINSCAYGLPLGAVRTALGGSAFWKEKVHAYLGYENGVPVSAAATVANAGSLFLALVATIPAAQRKGHGEATVRKALFEGARATGLTRTILHATDAGFPVYKRVGYHKVSTIHVYRLRA
jgi:GNAT superfamily N-acetyltransferase